jgi:pimeloyl-ACP methyl ester carboxylesterase
MRCGRLPGYSLWEHFISFDKRTQFALRRLWPEVVATDLRALWTDFQAPMLFVPGAADWQTPTSLTTEYVAAITAPWQELVLIENADHFLALVLPDTVLGQILAHVGGP